MAYAYSESNAVTFDDTTPAKTVEAVGTIDLNDTNVFLAVTVQVRVTWGASGDGNATVNFYTSPDGGTDIDTNPFYTEDIEYTAGATKKKSFQFHQIPWLRVGVKNNNVAVQDITVSAEWSGLYME